MAGVGDGAGVAALAVCEAVAAGILVPSGAGDTTAEGPAMGEPVVGPLEQEIKIKAANSRESGVAIALRRTAIVLINVSGGRPYLGAWPSGRMIMPTSPS